MPVANDDYVPGATLSIEWIAGRRLHDDLVFTLAGESYRSDSYYLAIDQTLLPDDEGPAKVTAVVAVLLGQWLARIEALLEDGVTFVPYDFSDQCTAWFRVVRHGESLSIAVGWSSLEAWRLSPADLGDVVPTDLRERDGARPVDVSRAHFLADLTLERDAFRVRSRRP